MIFKCFYKVSGDYEYEVCPWDRITQRNRWYYAEYGLGVWNGDESLPTRFHTGGSGPCPNGVNRASQINYYCGTSTQLVACSEPNMCYYVFDFEVDCTGNRGSMARRMRQTDFLPLMSNSTDV